MSDIVERLQDRAYVEANPFLCSTVAANEIERLRTEIDRLRAALAEYENAPVRLRHILKTGTMPSEDDPR